MPIKINFKRTHRYNVSAKDLYVIPIYTLDNTCVEYTVSPTTTGRDALQYVAQRLDIEDTCFFGFRYEAWTDDQRWLFLNKPVKKQLDKYARQHALVLSIMLFIDNPQYLSDARLRRQFYLQLRQDVATGQLKLTSKQAIKLTAYSLQADHGDFVDFETTALLWRERSTASDSTLHGSCDLRSVEHVDDVIWGYCQLRGVSQDNAIWYYLDEIRRLSSYGVQLFYGSTTTSEAAELAVSRNGLAISPLCTPNSSVSKLKWEDIKDLAYSRKTFTIQLLKKAKPILFLFEDTQDARYLWNFCIQMHNSYVHYWTHVKTGPLQLTTHVSEPPDILRGTGITLPALIASPIGDLNARQVGDRDTVQSYASGMANVGSRSITPTVSKTPTMVRHNALPHLVPALTSKFPQISECITSEHSEISSPSDVQSPVSISLATEPISLQSPNLQLDSQGGTLVGQWSTRSAADTIDSQMIARHCVACLPVAVCLRNAVSSSGTTTSKRTPAPSAIRPNNLSTKRIALLAANNQQVVSQSLLLSEEKRQRHHHHHHHHRARKHRLDQHHEKQKTQPLGDDEKLTSPEEAAARYNLSLTETSSGTSSESEFESDVCSTSAETSSSSNSSVAVAENEEATGANDAVQCNQNRTGNASPVSSSKGFRRLLGHHAPGVSTVASLRPILSGFHQHHYRLQQNWQKLTSVQDIAGGGIDGERNSLSREASGEVGKLIGASDAHSWLAGAKRISNALSESLTRRNLGTISSSSTCVANGTSSMSSSAGGNKSTEIASTPQILQKNSKSVGIAQVIRLDQSECQKSRKPCRPPIPPQIGSKMTGGYNSITTPNGALGASGASSSVLYSQRGASAGPGSSGSSGNTPASSFLPPILHHSLYESAAETRPRICLQPPSPPQRSIGLAVESFGFQTDSHRQPPQSQVISEWKSISEPVHAVHGKNVTNSPSTSWHLVRHPVWINATGNGVASGQTSATACIDGYTQESLQTSAAPPVPGTPFSAYFSLQASEKGTTGSLSAPTGTPDGFQLSWDYEQGSAHLPGADTLPVNSVEPSLAFTVELKRLDTGKRSGGESLQQPSIQQQVMSSSVSSSSSSSSSAAGGLVQVFSNSSSPSSPASSFGSPKLLEDKECSSSSTMSFSVCNEINQGPNNKTFDGVLQSMKSNLRKRDSRQQPHQQQADGSLRQRSLSGASSSGPMHLLTNSDIHQLLNLTKMRETALVHRLLAEYRQTLLLQQSLHANSVSTPNLTASQELRPTLPSLCVEYSADGHCGDQENWPSGITCCPPQHRGGSGAKEHADRMTTPSLSFRSRGYDGSDGGANKSTSSRAINQNQHYYHQQQQPYRHDRSHQAAESTDYVNASAFPCQQTNCRISMLSTTDNDSNATFRVLSEVDARNSCGGCSNTAQQSISNTRTGQKEALHLRHEESGATNSDLMTLSSSGWTSQRTTSQFLNFPDTVNAYLEAKDGRNRARQGLATPVPSCQSPGYRRPDRLPELVAELPTLVTSNLGAGDSVAFTASLPIQTYPNSQGGSYTRSKTFPNNQMRSGGHSNYHLQQQEESKVEFTPMLASGSNCLGEYENLELDSPPASSVNIKSMTDVSVKSSTSDVSCEDYALVHNSGTGLQQSKHSCQSRTYRRRRRPLGFLHCGGGGTECAGYVSKPFRPARLLDRRFSEGNDQGTSRRITLPNTSFESGRGMPSHVQLCHQHLRALEQFSDVKQGHHEKKLRSPTLLTRDGNSKQCYHLRYHVPHGCHYQTKQPSPPQPLLKTLHRCSSSRRTEKARSYDPFAPQDPQSYRLPQNFRKHRYHAHLRCSMSPVSGDDEPHRRGYFREATPDKCDICSKRKCHLCDAASAIYADEASSISSSRAASDSSLTSIPTVIKDVMVSSYEYECQHSDRVFNGLNRTASSFDSLLSGPRQSNKLAGRSNSNQPGRFSANIAGSHENVTPRNRISQSSMQKPPLLSRHKAPQPPPLPPPPQSYPEPSKTSRRSVKPGAQKKCPLGTCCHHQRQQHQDNHRYNPCAGYTVHGPHRGSPMKTRSRTRKNDSGEICFNTCKGSRDCTYGSEPRINDCSESSGSPPSLGLLVDDDGLLPLATNQHQLTLDRPKTLSSSSISQVDSRLSQRSKKAPMDPPFTQTSPAGFCPSAKPTKSKPTQPPLPPSDSDASQMHRYRNPGGLRFTASMTFTPSCGNLPYSASPSQLMDNKKSFADRRRTCAPSREFGMKPCEVDEIRQSSWESSDRQQRQQQKWRNEINTAASSPLEFKQTSADGYEFHHGVRSSCKDGRSENVITDVKTHPPTDHPTAPFLR